MLEKEKNEKLVKSKKRVEKHGEVMTPSHIVKAMLDLVKEESYRIDSKFLEPACGNGNFLVEIVRRKLQTVEEKYSNSEKDYEKYAIMAFSSIYGIDILPDNIEESRFRMYEVFLENYRRIFGKTPSKDCEKTIRYILEKNIILGNTLEGKTIEDDPEPIIFSEWIFVNENKVVRKDYKFSDLSKRGEKNEEQLNSLFFYDEDAFEPKPIREYSPVVFSKLWKSYDN